MVYREDQGEAPVVHLMLMSSDQLLRGLGDIEPCRAEIVRDLRAFLESELHDLERRAYRPLYVSKSVLSELVEHA